MGGEYKSEPVEGLRTANVMTPGHGVEPAADAEAGAHAAGGGAVCRRAIWRGRVASTDANDMIY